MSEPYDELRGSFEFDKAHFGLGTRIKYEQQAQAMESKQVGLLFHGNQSQSEKIEANSNYDSITRFA